MSVKTGISMAEILLVEDNPGDVRLTMEASKENKMYNSMSVVNDGVEALNSDIADTEAWIYPGFFRLKSGLQKPTLFTKFL